MEITTSQSKGDLKTSYPELHLFIPELLQALPLWQRDFDFTAQSASLATLFAHAKRHTVSAQGLARTLLHPLGLSRAPWAAWRYQVDTGQVVTQPLMCADPIHLQSGTERLSLTPQAPSLSEAEATQYIDWLNDFLQQDGWFLSAPTPQHWYLQALQQPPPYTWPQTSLLSDLARADVMAHLPRGGGYCRTQIPSISPLIKGSAFQQIRGFIRGSPPLQKGEQGVFSTYATASNTGLYWLRLFNELQMLLHSTDGAARVNSVWFWGESELNTPPRPATAPDCIAGGAVLGQMFAQYCEIPWQADYSLSLKGQQWLLLDQLCVPAWQDQPEAWQATLDELEQQVLQAVQLVWQQREASVFLYDCAGHVWHCQPPPRWRWWPRRPVHWSLKAWQ